MSQELAMPGSTLLERCRLVDPRDIPDGFQHGPVRDPLAVGEAPTACDGYVAVDPVEKLENEPRLSDACGAEDREELAGLVAHGLVEGVGQAPPLPLRPTIGETRRGARVEQPVASAA